MRKILKPLCVFVLSVSVLTLGACEPVSPTAPAMDAQYGVRSNAATPSRAWQRVHNELNATVREDWFSTPGGQLSDGYNTLTVPQFAVMGQLTHFVMNVTGHLSDVELSASRHSYNDVGARGFRIPVKLCLYYPGTNEERAHIRIAEYIENNDGTTTFVPVPTTYTPTQVCGELKHFSGYTMVED